MKKRESKKATLERLIREQLKGIRYAINFGGTYDAFVTEINASGSALVHSTYLLAGDGGEGIAVDASGNAYMMGYTGSTNFPTANAQQCWQFATVPLLGPQPANHIATTCMKAIS